MAVDLKSFWKIVAEPSEYRVHCASAGQVSRLLRVHCGRHGRSDRRHAVRATGHGDGLGIARRGRRQRGRGRGGRGRWSDCDRGGGRFNRAQ